MSVVISDYQAINKNPLNTSKAKNLYSFSKEKRFSEKTVDWARYIIII